jgi:hypothetical protein
VGFLRCSKNDEDDLSSISWVYQLEFGAAVWQVKLIPELVQITTKTQKAVDMKFGRGP